MEMEIMDDAWHVGCRNCIDTDFCDRSVHSACRRHRNVCGKYYEDRIPPSEERLKPWRDMNRLQRKYTVTGLETYGIRNSSFHVRCDII